MALWLAAFVTLSAADPIFSLSDLSDDGRLLFTITTDQPGWGSYDTLFMAHLNDDDRLETLSFFPERNRYFPKTAELEIQNRFGLYRIAIWEETGIRELKIHSSFVNDGELPYGRILPVSSSPDGKWIIVQEPDGPVRCRLVLYSSSGGDGIVISRNQVLDYHDSPALWSPDSRYLLYSRDGKLYHVSTRQIEYSRLQDESYREFGTGTLSNVKWAGPEALYYISGLVVNLVRPSVFFAKSFYTDPLPAGTVAGTLPMVFDSNSDSFWPSPDGRSVMVLKGKRNLFHFTLDSEDEPVNLPYLLLPGGSTVDQLWWRADGDIILLVGNSLHGTFSSQIYHLDSDSGKPFQFQDVPGIRRFAPSPDRLSIAVLENNGVSIRLPDNLEEINYFEHPDPRDLFWIDTSHLLIVGGTRIEIISLDGSENKLITLTQLENSGFNLQGRTGVSAGGVQYLKQAETEQWVVSKKDNRDEVLSPVNLESNANRVYLEDNVIMVRTVDGFGNRRLLPDFPYNTVSRSESEEIAIINTDEGRVINHGSRSRSKTAALVFNAIDSDEGLGEVLSILSDYDLHVSFFIGGDFIRRNPDSTRLLADSEHEIGSLFYTHMDMTDFRYSIDTAFVVRGMGRNEDEFFQVTGEEVSTIWHAPWYVISPSILDATEEMNYFYIGRDVDPLDWVTLDGPVGNRSLYRQSPELVERVLEELRPGSIIPVRIGKSGKRDDYFFQELDLLINGLLNDGYEIVSAGKLREQMK